MALGVTNNKRPGSSTTLLENCGSHVGGLRRHKRKDDVFRYHYSINTFYFIGLQYIQNIRLQM